MKSNLVVTNDRGVGLDTIFNGILVLVAVVLIVGGAMQAVLEQEAGSGGVHVFASANAAQPEAGRGLHPQAAARAHRIAARQLPDCAGKNLL